MGLILCSPLLNTFKGIHTVCAVFIRSSAVLVLPVCVEYSKSSAKYRSLCQGGHVFTPSVGRLDCVQDYKPPDGFQPNLLGRWGTGHTKNPLNTGAELDDGTDPGFIFCCEQMLVLV